MGHSKFNVVSCLFVRVFFLFLFLCALLFGVFSLETFKVQFLFILEEVVLTSVKCWFFD